MRTYLFLSVLLGLSIGLVGCGGGANEVDGSGGDAAADGGGKQDGSADGVSEAGEEAGGEDATDDGTVGDAGDDGASADMAEGETGDDGGEVDGAAGDASGDGAAGEAGGGDAADDGTGDDGVVDAPVDSASDAASEAGTDGDLDAPVDGVDDVPADASGEGGGDVPVGETGDVPVGDGAGGDLGDGPGIPTPGCVIGGPACNNCVDDDGDGLTDYFDPECVSPLDNDESSFATGIPGDNMDACKQDCFFDGDSGAGNDKCNWDLRCDSANPGGTDCPYDPDYKMCPGPQPQKCYDTCLKITPNGCDCFGCCTVTYKTDGGVMTRNVRLAATCTAADFGDTTKCPSCTQVSDCINTCELCEVCIGKPDPDPSCADGGTPPPQCSEGAIPCGPGGIDPSLCPEGTVCITGCCVTWAA